MAESYIRTNDHLTVVFSNGDTVTVYPSNPQYVDIISALRVKDYELVRKLSVPVAAVKAKINKIVKRGIDNVELRAGVVYYNDEPIHDTLTERIVSMATEGFDIEPMCKFLVNLRLNPSYRAVNELYPFLEKGNLPITEDGYFLAYKRVRSDYRDCYTGKFDNSVGTIVEMSRNEVNEDPNQTCSAGLHFCSRSYLPHYGTDQGNRTVILKINPADVVAIPKDYNDAKGRTCRYEVIGELEHQNEKPLEGVFAPSSNYKAPDEDDFDEDIFWDEENAILTALRANNHANILSYEDTNENILSTNPTFNKFQIQSIDSEGNVDSIFYSLQEAAEWAGVTPSAIRRVLKGERKTTGGYAWRQFGTPEAHPHHLSVMHEHGTLKSGQPHVEDTDL